MSLNFAAAAAMANGDHDQAEQYLLAAIHQRRRQGRPMEAQLHARRGNLALMRGNPQVAASELALAVQRFQEKGESVPVAGFSVYLVQAQAAFGTDMAAKTLAGIDMQLLETPSLRELCDSLKEKLLS